VPFFNFHALKYNANTVMMPLWAFATWTFLRSFETRKVSWAALAGVAAAAAMLGKYWSVLLLLGLGLAALADRRRAAYFRSPAPFVTIAVGLVALAPHLAWIWAHDFATFAYATSTHPGTFAEALASGAYYVAGAFAYAGAPIGLALVAVRPSRAALADTLWPATPERRLAYLSFVLPFLLPALAAAATQSVIVSLWGIGGMTLLPVVLFASPRVALMPAMARRIVAVAIAVPVIAVAVSPVISAVILRQGVPNRATHYRGLALEVERLWHETTGKPLKIVGSYDNLVYGTVFYFADRPTTQEIVSPRLTPWVDDARIARDGIALYCPVGQDDCLRALDARLARNPPARRAEVSVARTYLGYTDAPDRFVVAIVPPAQ